MTGPTCGEQLWKSAEMEHTSELAAWHKATSELLWLAQEGVESRMIIDKRDGDEVWVEPQQLLFSKCRG